MDYGQWLLVKAICLGVLTAGISVALIYVIVTLHLWHRQLRRIDAVVGWIGAAFDHVKDSLLGIRQSLGSFNEIASWAWQWYQSQQEQAAAPKKVAAKRKKA